jgi:hypothetical protein
VQEVFEDLQPLQENSWSTAFKWFFDNRQSCPLEKMMGELNVHIFLTWEKEQARFHSTICLFWSVRIPNLAQFIIDPTLYCKILTIDFRCRNYPGSHWTECVTAFAQEPLQKINQFTAKWLDTTVRTMQNLNITLLILIQVSYFPAWWCSSRNWQYLDTSPSITSQTSQWQFCIG